MTKVYVQFVDSAERVVMRNFLSPQDPAIYPNYAELEADDSRWLAYLNPQPTPEQVVEAKQVQKDSLLKAASISMTPVLLSLQLGDATDTEKLAGKAWRDYYRTLDAVDVTVTEPVWPSPPSSI